MKVEVDFARDHPRIWGKLHEKFWRSPIKSFPKFLKTKYDLDSVAVWPAPENTWRVMVDEHDLLIFLLKWEDR